MITIILLLCILSNVFVIGFCREYKVYYDVYDYGKLAETKFLISHNIIKRSAFGANLSSTASPSTSVKTTQNTTNPKTSYATASTKLPTRQPFLNTTGQPSSSTTGQAKTNHSTTANRKTNRPSIPWTTTPRNNGTTQMPVNYTNGTNTTFSQDNHRYFTSRYFSSGGRWWFDVNDGSAQPKLQVHLTKNLRYSETIKTSFTFPYYGHEINKITITNKGYLFLGEEMHKFNASMQYVAPLMADFGAHLHNETSIHYVDTGDRFTVEWKNLKLQNQQAGTFSFQCSVLKNGTIIFAYKNIPVAVSKIKNNTFPVRVGLSDSYVVRYVRYGLFFIEGKFYTRIIYYIYYRYHQIKLGKELAKSGSAFVMTPLPNCIMYKSCDSCMNSKTQFSCRWCPKIGRCSDGIDRHRHDWLVYRCNRYSVTKCRAIGTVKPKSSIVRTVKPKSSNSSKQPKTENNINGNRANQKTKSRGGGRKSGKRAGAAVAIVITALICIVIACWIAYAYTHPLSKSGMFLMQYGNPRKWFNNSGSGSTGGGKITFKSMPHESTA
ncbi:plexin domain-containing protein 2-like [Dendronephthya gigantea]|uniref:plexin domain-containing protein 2-like n=1 Tax=Dendronephthya gigantea TaxID=151771 RepID=UPI00106CE07A|nr:plexin domain-containing protein 2-like [Dendronephthya gigantea]